LQGERNPDPRRRSDGGGGGGERGVGVVLAVGGKNGREGKGGREGRGSRDAKIVPRVADWYFQ
jgi:hypothetical protein